MRIPKLQNGCKAIAWLTDEQKLAAGYTSRDKILLCKAPANKVGTYNHRGTTWAFYNDYFLLAWASARVVNKTWEA